MINIEISAKIKKNIPKIKLGLISGEIIFKAYCGELWEEILIESKRISKMQLDDIKKIPTIESTREAYKALGKEPSRYRPSAEALHRRIISGKEVYQISNIVDVINLTSLKTGYSIGGFDETKINGKVIFDSGTPEMIYETIGRGLMNIDCMPVFIDQTGAFGNPSSDSLRTMITEKTTKILMIVQNYGGHQNFEKIMETFGLNIIKYCEGKKIEIKIID